MQPWLNKLQFITPRAIIALKKYDRDMLRYRNRKQIKNHNPEESAFIWKYRIKDVIYDITNLDQLSFILIDTDGQTQTVSLPDLFGDKTTELSEFYRLLHERDRFIVGLIVANLAVREAKKEKALKVGHQAASVSQLGREE